MLSILPRLIFVVVLLSMTTFVNAAPNDKDPAIQGYSPVSYFTKGIAERGDREHAVEYKGKIYYLASKDQATTFRQSPEKYIPKMDLCPYSMLHGRRLSIDPTSFKIIAGSLLLFHDSVELNARKAWNKKVKEHDINESDLVERSKQNYEFFESEAMSTQSSF